MEEFARLLDTLSFTGSTLAKRRLMARYFKERPDPERGFALAALTGSLSFPLAKPNVIRELVSGKVDPVLYGLSRDYVGDMAETVALIWPVTDAKERPPALEEVVEVLMLASREAVARLLGHWLDALEAVGRWALLKLITGNIRIGVSARLAKTALADAYGREVDELEQLWHSLTPPYANLFAWLEGKSEKPPEQHVAVFMPMMLSHPIEEPELLALNLEEYQTELKWDGIRIQMVRSGDLVALYSRTGDDISHTFPDIAAALQSLPDSEFVLDGELLAKNGEDIAPFNALQQRLNRKIVTAAVLKEFPGHVRLYDILIDKGEDIRPLPLLERRIRLESWLERNPASCFDLSSVITAPDHAMLQRLRGEARSAPQNGVEGLMIKRKASPYIGGRPRGHWFKWKRDTLTLDCVLLYAQRGSGKRSSYYSDYTFGVWSDDALVPIGKAYSGFTDEELVKLDKWIRSNTTNRFGPVREVQHELVIEIEFDSIHPSARHKSGLAMRFPRVHRIRWDKPAHEADSLQNALRLTG